MLRLMPPLYISTVLHTSPLYSHRRGNTVVFTEGINAEQQIKVHNQLRSYDKQFLAVQKLEKSMIMPVH